MENWGDSRILETYADNLQAQTQLDTGLRDKRGREEWLAAFRQRAERLDRIFEENQGIAGQLRQALEEPLTAEAAQFLYGKLLRRSRRRESYGRVALPLLALLVPYYEENHDPEKLVRLYSLAYQILSTAGAGMEGETGQPKSGYSRKIIALREEYGALRDENARLEIFMAYYMIAVEERSEGLLTADESYHYLQEMLAFWESPEVQRLDGENEHIAWYVSLAQRDWLAVEEAIDGAGQETRDYFLTTAERCFQQEMEEIEEPWEGGHDLWAAYCHAQVMAGEATWEEAAGRFLDYYRQRMENIQVEELGVEDADFLLEAPLVLLRWLGACNDEALKAQVLAQVKGDVETVLLPAFEGATDAAVNEGLSKLCFALLPYLEGREEKERWLLELVIRRQFFIYLHSVMVGRLAEAIAQELDREEPALFDGLREKIGNQPMADYIAKCALFHDVGKSEIADIINTQARELDADELAEIRRHPQYGRALLGEDRDLERYRDVILGHHRFYNGQGGYPETFDNTTSPYRFIIDLIAVCDGLDAATDTLGRNYKRTKTFDQVLAELGQGKGSRYNGDIVSHIEGSPALQAKLRALVGEERGEIAYEIYTAARS